MHKNQDVTPEMAAKLEEAAEAVAAAIEQRKQAILEAHRDGEPLRQIADRVGMSWSGVRKIINQETGATP